MQFQSWFKFALLLYELSNKKGVKGGNNSSSLISPHSVSAKVGQE